MTRVREKQSKEYMAGHKRIATLMGYPKSCDNCGSTDEGTRYEWANLSGHYLNVEDYIRLCQPCHIKMDGSANKGESNPNAKLTEDNVREIRRRYKGDKRGPNTQLQLGKEFGVHQRKIWEIVNGKAWKHVQ